MDEGDLAMLDATIAAHQAWLGEEGVALHREPGCLTAAAVLAHLGPIRAQGDVKAQLLRTAALANLVDLCGLRTRAIGLPQVSAMLAAQMKESIDHRSRKLTKSERLEAKAIQAVHDNGHAEVILERSQTARDRLRTLQRSLIDENPAMDGRWRKLQRAQCGDVGLPGLAAAKIANLWIRSRTEAFLADLKWYEGQLHGAASTSTLGCQRAPDAKAWHDRLGGCVLRAKDAGRRERCCAGFSRTALSHGSGWNPIGSPAATLSNLKRWKRRGGHRGAPMAKIESAHNGPNQ
jgi:hypothetical protein